MIPILHDTEIVHEEKSEDGAIHIIERRCKLNVDAPFLLKKVLVFVLHVVLPYTSLFIIDYLSLI